MFDAKTRSVTQASESLKRVNECAELVAPKQLFDIIMTQFHPGRTAVLLRLIGGIDVRSRCYWHRVTNVAAYIVSISKKPVI